MSTIPLEKVEEATRALYRHHQTIENFPPGFVQEGEVDEAKEALYVRIRQLENRLPPADFHRRVNKCYGRHAFSRRWLRIQPLGPFPRYLQAALQLLTERPILSVTDEGELWNVEIQTDEFPLQTNPEEFFRTLFKGERSEEQEALLNQMVEMARNLKVAVRIWVIRESFEIAKFSVRSRTPRGEYTLTVTFSRSEAAMPRVPSDALDAPDKELPLMTLFLPNYRPGGWCESIHRILAQRTVEFVKETDEEEGRYKEIYAEEWGSTQPDVSISVGEDGNVEIKEPNNYKGPTEDHHPILIGAHYEDHYGNMPDSYYTWFAPDPGEFFNTDHPRDYHHYGGEGLGLWCDANFWWDDRNGGAPPPEQDNHYFSAVEWGWGRLSAVSSLNKLTFCEAINQYNRYSFEGRRNAYLMLGHVLHLLQDQAQPDHARLVPHPGSSYTEPEAYDEFYVLYVLPGQIAAIYFVAAAQTMGWSLWGLVAAAVVAGEVFASAYGILIAAIDEDEMGFERLIKSHWHPDRIEDSLKEEGIRSLSSYDAYFSDMASFSKQKAHEKGLSSPLGMQYFPLLFLLDALMVPPLVPELLVGKMDPEIDYPEEKDPYFQLMDEVAPRAVSLSTGLIRHFFDIVNYPPFLERTVILRAAQALSPDKFAHFQECPDATVMYDVIWSDETEGGNVVKRTKTVRVKRALCAGQNAYVFLIFGPSTFPLKSKTVEAPTLTLVGQSPDSAPIETPVTLSAADDIEVGRYYWGCFQPEGFSSSQNYALTMRIQARDASAHYGDRDPSGDVLDSNPATVARVGLTDPPYSLTGYEPGEDVNHSFEVAPSIAQDAFEPNNTFDNAYALDLRGQSKAGKIVASLIDATDVDFFRIDWNWIPLGYLGSYFLPAVGISGSEEFGNKLSLKFYSSSSYESLLRSTNKSLSVEWFGKGMVDGTTLYVEVENLNFYCQGALRYSLSAAYGLIPVKPLPALINRWWWLLPPDERRIRQEEEVITYLDGELLLEDLERLVPLLGVARAKPRKQGQTVMARVKRDIAKIAEEMGIHEHAERLYSESSVLFRSCGRKAEEAAVLRSLLRIYLALGRQGEAAKVSRRLNQIK